MSFVASGRSLSWRRSAVVASSGLLVGAAADAAPPSVTVTNADNGTTVHLEQGQQLTVTLTNGAWQDPRASGSHGLYRVSGSFDQQGANATFSAVADGFLDVTDYTDAGCLHALPACAIAQQGWT